MAPIMKTASMKPEVALLDNDELNGVDNEADDWQVNYFQILDKIWHFWRFLSTLLALACNFWELVKLDGFLLDNDELNGVDNEAFFFFQILDKTFWLFAYFFGTFL